MLFTKLELIARRAKQEPERRFTALIHLLNDEEFLVRCFNEVKGNKAKAVGVDGVSAEEYGKNLKENLSNLVGRLKVMKYWPLPVRRTYIPKDGGKMRPLGIPAIEDKVMQTGETKILQAIYEGDFLDVSHGYRPGRGCHTALEAVRQALYKRTSYVVEVDIKGFFDNVDHKWLMECLRQRIVDPNFLRLMWRTLKSGIMEEGIKVETEAGTPQGGVISPMLSNIYLHYILDLWFERVLTKQLRGYAELVRYCDDFIICVQYKDDACMILDDIKARLAKFGLEVSPEKTKIVEFGRFAKTDAEKKGRKPDRFDFLGFTHYSDTARDGGFKVGRKTSGKKLCRKLKAMSLWLKTSRNTGKLKDIWRILRAKLTGHYNYYGLRENYRGMMRFYFWTIRLTYKWLNRRSQRRSFTWDSFRHYLQWQPLPKPVCRAGWT